MAEPCPAATASPSTAAAPEPAPEPAPELAPEPAPEGERPPENPAAAYSLGPDDFFSSQENMVREEVPDSRSLLFIAWVFCCVGSIIIVVPLAFILMPLFSGAVARVKASVVSSTHPAEVSKLDNSIVSTKIDTESTRIRKKSTRTPIPTATFTPITTVAVPANCRKTSPPISVDIRNIKNDSFENRTLKTVDSSKPVYCIFNISRVRMSPGIDFLLHQFPWPICPRVIYWSVTVNVTDGHILSRAPQLDAYNGFYNISFIGRHYRADTKVLLTLGGYTEDSGLFSMLGSGTLAETSLTQMVIVMLYRLQFHGLNIHLTEDPACEQYFKGRFGGLRSFIIKVRELVSVNAPISDFKVTLMVGTNKRLAKHALPSLGDLVDLVFVDTFELYSDNFSASFTGPLFSTSYGDFLTNLKRDINGHHGKMCYSISSLTRVWPEAAGANPMLPMPNRAGYGSLLDFCDQQRFLPLLSSTTGVRYIRYMDGTNYQYIRAYFFDDKTFSLLASDCLLVHSVECGVPVQGCPPGSTTDVLNLLSEAFAPPPSGR